MNTYVSGTFNTYNIKCDFARRWYGRRHVQCRQNNIAYILPVVWSREPFRQNITIMLKHRKVYIRFRFARHPSPARIYNRVADILIIFLSNFGCFDFCAIKKTYHGQRERDVWCCVVQRWPCVLGVIGWFFTSVAKINFQGSVFPGGYGIHFLIRSWTVSSYVRCGVFGLNGEKYCDSRRCSTRSNDVQRFTLLCIFNLGLCLCE